MPVTRLGSMARDPIATSAPSAIAASSLPASGSGAARSTSETRTSSPCASATPAATAAPFPSLRPSRMSGASPGVIACSWRRTSALESSEPSSTTIVSTSVSPSRARSADAPSRSAAASRGSRRSSLYDGITRETVAVAMGRRARLPALARCPVALRSALLLLGLGDACARRYRLPGALGRAAGGARRAADAAHGGARRALGRAAGLLRALLGAVRLARRRRLLAARLGRRSRRVALAGRGRLLAGGLAVGLGGLSHGLLRLLVLDEIAFNKGLPMASGSHTSPACCVFTPGGSRNSWAASPTPRAPER